MMLTEDIKHKINREVIGYPFIVDFEDTEVIFKQELVNRVHKQISFSEQTLASILSEDSVKEMLEYIQQYFRTLCDDCNNTNNKVYETMKPPLSKYNNKPELFTAKQANKAATNHVNKNQIYDVLGHIKERAQEGHVSTYIHYPLSSDVINQLQTLGYKVESLSGIATQRDGIYHYISWK